MADIITVAGGLLVTMLAVGGIAYVALGGDVDFEWESRPDREP